MALTFDPQTNKIKGLVATGKSGMKYLVVVDPEKTSRLLLKPVEGDEVFVLETDIKEVGGSGVG